VLVFLCFVVGHIEMHMEWCNWEQVNQWHRYGIIINNLKCHIGLHHCNRLIETIEMEISFTYIRARIREICIRHYVGPVGPTLGHVATYWHTGCHVSMTPHQSKRNTSRRIRRRHVFSTRIQGLTTRANGLQTASAPWTVISDHTSVTGGKHNARHGGPRSVDPLDWPNRPCHGSPSTSTWCFRLDPKAIPRVHRVFAHRCLSL
jgi:hypothetical protein